MAGRKVITEAMVLDALAAGRLSLSIPPNALVTPLARDTARAKGISFSTGETKTEPQAGPSASGTGNHVVALGSDHGGFGYKQQLAPVLGELGWTVLDVGTDSEAPCDYPDFAFAVGRMVATGKAEAGIMIDGAGIGSAMVCNKVPGIRAACAYNEFTAWNARAHNNANVLTLGSRTLGIDVCKRIVHVFLTTSFEGGRHEPRVAKIADVESRFLK